jgi:hypothetical protein
MDKEYLQRTGTSILEMVISQLEHLKGKCINALQNLQRDILKLITPFFSQWSNTSVFLCNHNKRISDESIARYS